MQIKTFTLAEVDKANEFIKSAKTLANGIQFHQGNVVVLFTDEPAGINKSQAVAIVSDELAKVQKNLIGAELERRFYHSLSIKKLGGKEKQDQINAHLAMAEQAVEDAKTQVRQYREMIDEIEKGEFTY